MYIKKIIKLPGISLNNLLNLRLHINGRFLLFLHP